MSSTVDNVPDLVTNLDAFWLGAETESPHHEAFLKLLKLGKNFVCRADRTRMAPSRFAGYFGNTLTTHFTAGGRDGGVTDAALTRLLGNKRLDRAAESSYKRICASFGVTPSAKERRYWIIPDTEISALAPEHFELPREELTLARQLGLPITYGARMRAILATTASLIRRHRPEWYRARLDGPNHIRIFYGHLIVATLGGVPSFSARGEEVIEPDFGASEMKEGEVVASRLVEA